MEYLKIFLTLVIVVCCCESLGAKGIATISEARNQCVNKSGLVKYTQLRTIGSFNYLESNSFGHIDLKDGQSAWIYGAVKFTDSLLYFHGCGRLKSNHTENSIKQKDFVLYRCVEKCRSIRTTHIGLKQLSDRYVCYCFKSTDKFTDLPLSNCTHYIPNVSSYWKNELNSNILSVYKVLTDKWVNQKSAFARECLIAKLATNRSITHEEVSCYGKPTSLNISGFVCNAVLNFKQQECNNSWDSFCYVQKSTNLSTARTHCYEVAVGKLLPRLRDNIAKNITHFNKSVSFWTGSFRAFTVTNFSDTSNNMSESCLSILRDGTRLYLDPDDCNSCKPFICSDDVFITKSATTPVRETVGQKDTSEHGRCSTTSVDQEHTSEHGRYSTTTVDQEDTSDHGRYSTTTVDQERTSEHGRYSTTSVDQEDTSDHGQYSTTTVDQERTSEHGRYSTTTVDQEDTSEHGQYSTTTVDQEYTQKTDKETNTKVAQEEFNNEYLIYVYTGSCILLLIFTSGIIVKCYRRRKLSRRRIDNSEGNNETQESCTNQTDQSPLAVTIQLNNVDINDANASSHLYCEPIMMESVSKSSDDYDHVCLKESSKKTFLNEKCDNGHIYGFPKETNMNNDYDVLNLHGTTNLPSSKQTNKFRDVDNLYGYPEDMKASDDYDTLNSRVASARHPNEQYCSFKNAGDQVGQITCNDYDVIKL
ncbi:hypothetical protein ACF0H5_015641 [Mactra antiquata]